MSNEEQFLGNINLQELSEMQEFLEAFDHMQEDDNGVFDKRTEPVRALALAERTIIDKDVVIAMLDRALMQVMADGQELVVDITDVLTDPDQGHGVVRISRHGDHLHITAAEPSNEDISYVQRVAMFQDELYQEQYYIAQYEHVLVERGMTPDGVSQSQYSSSQLCSLLNDFWFALPDSTAIRENDVFFTLCDLCEGDHSEEQG